MQQATTAKPPNESAPDAAARHASLRNRFVINLCGSTTPVSLTPPDHAGLKRFTFFVSRRREEGRERFRLHMGYFDSQEEAERLLDIVREIYPAAWAGLAPGQRLAQAEADAAAAAAAASAAESAGAAATTPASAIPQTAVAPVATAVTAAPASAPIAAVAVVAAENSAPAAQLNTAPAAPDTATTIIQRPDGVSEATINQPVAVTAPDVVAQVAVEPVAAAAAPPPSADDMAVPPDGAMELPALSLVPDEGRRVDPLGARKDDTDAAARALSNVRAAIASLGDTTTNTPTISPLPELKPAARVPAVPKTAAAVAADSRALSDTAALRVLESRDTASDTTVNQPRLPAADASPTGKNEKPTFAVQLLWSVQPIDITQIPQLAIFSAYTLYGAEGNRDGRRWYGVRLGFFTDAVSAKQVAHYVRSDFSTVSVVPVTVRERERAKLAAARPEATPVTAAPPAAAAAAAATPAAPAAAAVTKPAAAAGFDFIEDKQPQARATATGATPAPRSPRGAPGKRAKSRPGRAAAHGRAKPKAMTLEETLEILGAGELKVDEGKRASINDGLAKLPAGDAGKDKPSRFGRLLERLSGIGS